MRQSRRLPLDVTGDRAPVLVGVPLSPLGIVTANELHIPVSDPRSPRRHS
jgi:hypothetical protein